MAVVYKARCHLLKRYVAVKVLRPELVENEEFVVRFKQESQSAASLSHPNIVNIYDVGQEGDLHYIVMEYINGKTLKDYIREKGCLELGEAVSIALQICSALSHAHRNQIVHRDIKPQNILLNEEGDAKVADFGIARAATNATVTMAGASVIGSVHYFSPEQARGGHVDKKSDIYSLGIVLYEMVTGTLPFEGDSAITVALKHIQERVTPVGEIRPDVPKSVQYIIEKATEKDQDKRYTDANAMIADLSLALIDPDGSFITRDNPDEDEQATRVIPPVRAADDEKHKGKREKTEKKGKKLRTALLAVGGILLIALILYGAYWVFYSIYKSNFGGADEVEVPMVEGLTEEAARSALELRGLEMNPEYENHRKVPEGEVISQNPKAGIKVRIDSKVDVVISTGVRTVKVPPVTGMTQREAEIEIENAGLKVGEPEYIFSNIPSGYVAEQEIPANTEVAEGTEIVLHISKGPEDNLVRVGSYTGGSEQDARIAIANDGLKVGKVHKENNNEYSAGTVFKQYPENGQYVDAGRSVELWVSLGPQTTRKKSLDITITGSKESVQVKVVRVSDGFVIHNDSHRLADGTIRIPIEGSGVVGYDIYIDGEFLERRHTNFDKEESGS